MVSKTYSSALFVTLVLSAAPATSLADARAGEVLACIEKEGVRMLLSHTSTPQFFALLTDIEHGIGKGDPQWAEVARRIRKVERGHNAEELDFIVSMALPKAPTLVISLLDDPFPVESVCTDPFDMEEDDAVELRYLLASEDALLKLRFPPEQIVTDAEYIADDAPRTRESAMELKRKACLHGIQAAKCYVADCRQVGRDQKRK